MKFIGVLLVAAIASFADVEGVVMNQTTGKPQAGATLVLTKLGQGMQQVAEASADKQGNFKIAHRVDPSSPYLLQAQWQGVTYNTMLQPGIPTTAVRVNVFDASAKVPEAKVAQDMILLEPSAQGLAVNETVIWRNEGKQTYFDAKNGTLRFWLPPSAKGQVRVTIVAPQGMPIQRPAEKTDRENVYKVAYAVKPGETRFDLTYALPPTDRFESRVLHDGPVRIVAPKGVTLTGDAVTSLGPEPRTQATVYNVKAREYAVSVQGAGSLREAASAAAAEQSPEDQGVPQIEVKKARIYDRVWWVMGLGGVILALGFAMLFRASAPARSR